MVFSGTGKRSSPLPSILARAPRRIRADITLQLATPAGMKSKAHSKGRAAKPVVKDRTKTATACSVDSMAPSKTLLQAVGFCEGLSGKEAVAAFLGRYGFKLPKTSALGAEMFKIMKTASACGDEAGKIAFDAAEVRRMSAFMTAKKFLVQWRKGA